MNSTTDVLICGAGPTGLTTALSILHHCPGLSITIVDALETGQNQSRALTLHAGTVESLSVIGCAEPVVKEGMKVSKLQFQTASRTLFAPDFTLLSQWTKYPHALLISQSHTERVLNRLLRDRGVTVIRPVRVIGLEEVHDTTEAFKLRISFEDGSNIRARYLIGADGSKSIVREFANIGCSDTKPGYNPLLRMIDAKPILAGLADVVFESSTPKEILPITLTGTFGPNGFLFFAPFKDTTYSGFTEAASAPTCYRIGFMIEPDEKVERSSIDKDVAFIQSKIDRSFAHMAAGVPKATIPRISKVFWANTFRIRYAVADTFFKSLPSGGKILLAGDAAHVHSPVGGQGMNMGMSDGLALGSAIGLHLKSNDDAILQKFSDERRSIAIQVVNATKIGTFMISLKNPIARFFRDNFLSGFSSLPFVGRRMAWNTSGLGLRKQSSFT